jgi:hypothetical protein
MRYRGLLLIMDLLASLPPQKSAVSGLGLRILRHRQNTETWSMRTSRSLYLASLLTLIGAHLYVLIYIDLLRPRF